MSSTAAPPPEPPPALPVAAAAAASPGPQRGAAVPRLVLALLVLLAGGALLASAMLWQKLQTIQETLARQSADTSANAIEARAVARQAQEVARDAAARQAVLESRLAEVTLQRAQLEELVQGLSRSRDDNLVVDIESALRLAQQQAQLTGSLEPLIAALRTADQRLARAAQPRLGRLRAAIGRDIDRLRAAPMTDVPGVLARIDEVVRQIDDLPLANAVGPRATPQPRRAAPAPAAAASAAADPVVPALPAWWQRWRDAVLEEARGLVRVSRIDRPEAVLTAPDQAFFLRENLKLKLLNARLSLLSRQNDTARADLAAATAALQKYFDPSSRRTQAAVAQLQQLQSQVRSAEPPRIDETFAAIATAAAGR